MLNIQGFLNTVTTRSYALPIVILYVTEGCNLRCVTCSYRDRLANELSLDEIAKLAESLHGCGLKRIVFSGGEPLLRRDFPQICDVFRRYGVKQSLLTNGVLLDRRFDEIKEFLSEIIISVDGVDSQTHNGIRGVESLETIIKGIRRCLAAPRRPAVSIRTVLQKSNFRQTPAFVDFAKTLGADRISFLPVDVLSGSFGRSTHGGDAIDERLVLTPVETVEFRQVVFGMMEQYEREFATRFISESPEKMIHIVQYFEALAGLAAFPPTRCNAPMVSAVITSTGNIQPCFFLPAYGNIREDSVRSLLNSSSLQSCRSAVRRQTVERCKTCVCTMYKPPLSALTDRF